ELPALRMPQAQVELAARRGSELGAAAVAAGTGRGARQRRPTVRTREHAPDAIGQAGGCGHGTRRPRPDGMSRILTRCERGAKITAQQPLSQGKEEQMRKSIFAGICVLLLVVAG